MVDEPRTYRHSKIDVEVSLARVESMLRGKDDGLPARIGATNPLGSSFGAGGMYHADAWNVRVLVEELRAQLEEQGPRPVTPGDPVVARAIDELRAWIESAHSGPLEYVELAVPGINPYGIVIPVLTELLRKAEAGNRAPAPADPIELLTEAIRLGLVTITWGPTAKALLDVVRGVTPDGE